MYFMIFAIIVPVLVALIAVSARQPAAFRIIRSTAINAPPAAVFAQVNDLHHWQEWSHWAKKDPQARTTFDGAALGLGASFTWDGNKKVGAGRMTITESAEPDRIVIRLDFTRPFVATNTAEFAISSTSKATLVSWTMTGNNNFIGKAFGLFINVDAMIGGDFEQGLANLKTRCEAATAINAPAPS